MLFVFDDIGSLLPIIMMVAVWTIILNNNSKRRRKRHDEPVDYDAENGDAENLPQESRQEERENAPQPMPMETHEEHKPRSGRDLAAEFERKLRAKSAKADAKNDGVVTDSEVAVHREKDAANKPAASEKALPVGTDYSKWNAGMQTAYASAMQDKNFCTVPEAHEVHFDDNARKRRFARPALVLGFIMSQVLDKPAALKPYDDHLSSL